MHIDIKKLTLQELQERYRFLDKLIEEISAYFCIMNTKIARIIKIEVTPPIDNEKRPSEVFHEISKEHGRKLNMKEIKRELEKKF